MPNAAGDVIIIDGSKLKTAEKIGIRLETAQVHCLVNEQHMCLFCAHFSKLQRKGEQSMPKTKFQNIVFTLMMSFLMVYAMICYNISMNIGGMTNQVFLMAFHEMLTLPTAKAGGFLFLPPLHWQIPYGTAMSYTVSTGYIYTVPACPAVQFSYLYADCSCSPFFKILMPAFVSRS